MPKLRKVRVSNPHKKRNIAEVFIVPNPRRKSRKSYSRRSKAHKSNPGRRHKNFSFRRRHRRNPSGAGAMGFNTKSLLYLALGAGAGVVGSKYLTSMVLGTNNSGPIGYAGQTISTLVLGWLARKFVSKEAAVGVVAGGLGGVALRIFQEQVSQTAIPAGAAAQMSGLGDPDMAALGIGLGDYIPGTFGVPARFQPGGAVPALPTRSQGRGRARG